MTDSERFLARVLLAWLDYDGGLDELDKGVTVRTSKHHRTAGFISDYLEDRGITNANGPTTEGARLLSLLRETDAAERRAAEEAGRKLTKSEPRFAVRKDLRHGFRSESVAAFAVGRGFPAENVWHEVRKVGWHERFNEDQP